jgi:acetyltransferase-like isoleucine patch superfamily enzyme
MISKMLFNLYGLDKSRLRKIIVKLLLRMEGGQFYSKTIRDIYSHYHEVEVGMYTQGAFSASCSLDRHTRIGRYCSISANVAVMNRNHPMEFKSTHAFFFNPALGVCKEDLVAYTPLEIGNDVWIGHGAIIHPHVRRIGDGAVIGAGAVVNKDVPPYAVVTGNPSRIVRYRFSKKVIEELLASRWWEKSIGELKPHLQEFRCALSDPAERQGEGE